MNGSTTNPNFYARPGVFQSSYSPFTHAGMLVAAFYCGIFVMLNNHYVFRPKLIKYAKKITQWPKTLQRDAIRSTIVDLVMNLRAITFSMSSAMMSGSTNNIECFVIADSLWMGLYASIVFYLTRNQPHQVDWKYALKNIVGMALGYICLLVHFQLNFLFISFGIVLVLITVANQLTNIYYDKVERYIDRTFFREELEDLPTIDHLYVAKSLYPDVKTLATNFPVEQRDLAELRMKFHSKRNSMKLKSKAIVYEKLHEIYSRIYLSLRNHKNNEERKTMQYYGRLNGTIPNDKVQKLADIKERRTEKYLSEKQEPSEAEDSGTEEAPIEQPPGCLTYMFPISMLEYTEVISVVFSLAINLGYGVLLDYCLQISRTLPCGNVFNCLLAFTMLPILPKVNIDQLQGTMAAQSVIRYGIAGVALIVQTVLYNQDGSLTLGVSFAQPLVFLLAVQLGYCCYYCLVVLLIRWQQYKFLTLCFVGVVGGELYLSILYRSYFST